MLALAFADAPTRRAGLALRIRPSLSMRAAQALLCLLAAAPMVPAQPGPPPGPQETQSAWTASRRGELSTALTGLLAAQAMTIQPGSWQFFDVANCMTNPGGSCWGSNPDTPYGYPLFTSNGGMTNKWRMREDEAVVLIVETPPEVKYFSFVHYLYSRDEGGPARMTYYASLGDSLNDLKIGTAEAAPRTGPNFAQLAVIVLTADANMYQQISDSLRGLSFPTQGINVLPMPALLPLYMGRGTAADQFTLLFRAAFPSDPVAYANYTTRMPFSVLRVTPQTQRQALYINAPGFTEAGSGVSEPADLADSVNALAADVRAHYAGQYTFELQGHGYKTDTGYDCIQKHINCGGDNHDAIYERGLNAPWTPRSRRDMVIVVGVNHEHFTKAKYLNQAVVEPVKEAGIVSFGMNATEGSALYHAGITGPQDPRRLRYADLYTYVITYDCANMAYCLEVPEPTPDDPVGITFGNPLKVTGRLYNDPLTAVRPGLSEIVVNKVYEAYWNAP